MTRQKSAVRLVAEPLITAAILAVIVRAAISVYVIPSASMRPSLESGDHILVTPYRFTAPRRGDVVVLRAPNDNSTLLVKRIIGLPGDLIDSRSGRVRLGQHAIAEPYLLKQAATGDIPPQIIPADCFFVMGDNREDSADSRRWGAVPRDLVVGHVRMVLWSSAGGAGERTARATTFSPEKASAGTSRLSRFFKCVQ
ncbi:MAG TPA: signal peptidase I [Thermoanaerobaculia bacterium]|nr:signal peptidase I [Thermoanaerobaculia bacterium]